MNEELKHYGVPGMKWGHRKAYKLAVANAKQEYRNRNSSIQKRYDMAEANIEKRYKKGQLLSKKDEQRELDASNKAIRDRTKSKAIYKDALRKAKIKYKADVEKSKAEYKNNYKLIKEEATTADKLLFNNATRKRAALYMTQNKMSMSEAKKKATKEAVRNTVTAIAAIGGISLTKAMIKKMM